eukprot:1383117-Amphidinium_carterae.1
MSWHEVLACHCTRRDCSNQILTGHGKKTFTQQTLELGTATPVSPILQDEKVPQKRGGVDSILQKSSP